VVSSPIFPHPCPPHYVCPLPPVDHSTFLLISFACERVSFVLSPDQYLSSSMNSALRHSLDPASLYSDCPSPPGKAAFYLCALLPPFDCLLWTSVKKFLVLSFLLSISYIFSSSLPFFFFLYEYNGLSILRGKPSTPMTPEDSERFQMFFDT